MRTTLEIDDDLMATAKHLARQQGATIGHVISQLARQSLTANAPEQVRNGVRVFASKTGASKPGLRLVNALRDDD
jgi:hypothetical protein